MVANSQVAFRTNQQGHTEYFFYDKEGRQNRHVNPRGITTETKVNVYGKPVLQACTDLGAEVNNRYTYDAFGNLLNKQEGIENRILYTGQQYDRETEQYYLRARYYNPVIGRFTQEDTFRGDGLNL